MPSGGNAGGFLLTRQQLMQDLYRAYLDARRHKRGKPYQMKFELHLEDNLHSLCDDLWSRTYKAQPSKCFVISDPTLREVFAADFRDRVVHHLYYNYTYDLFDRSFIDDCYSCRKGKGTLYGVQRMERHIREESQGFTRPCYVLKMDISGYFMHIDRQRLLDITFRLLSLTTNYTNYTNPPDSSYQDDNNSCNSCNSWSYNEFLCYLTREIVLLDPTENCRIFGRREDWGGLPRAKSLFHSPRGCGLPIGNLTSQVFSNVYLNVFDQWMKRQMRCSHYGRYVDDFYVVGSDREWLLSLASKCEDFLWQELGLRVNRDKTIIYDVRHGVPFLGCFLKPWRTYVGNSSWRRMKRHLLHEAEHAGVLRLRSCVNSYLGLLRHVNSYRLTQRLFLSIPRLRSIGLITSFDRKLILSDYTLDTLMLNRVLRMIQDEDYPIGYADVELWCHEYVDRYL